MTTVERPCVFCGGEVTSTNPETDFCRNCFYSGRAAQRTLQPFLDRIDALDEVVRNTEVMHTGGGCFNLAVWIADGRFLTPSVGYRGDGADTENGPSAADMDATVWPEPGFPDVAAGERWCLVVSDSEESWGEWDESKLWIPQALYTEDELVAAIRDIATGKIARPKEDS